MEMPSTLPTLLTSLTVASMCLALFTRNRLKQATSQLTDKERLVQTLNQEALALKTELIQAQTRLEAETKANQDKQALILQLEEKFSNIFKALSADALKSNNKSFLDLAESTFQRLQEASKSDLAKHHQSINNTVTPIQKALEKFDEKVNTLEKSREGAYASLSQQVKNLLTAQLKLESETANLAKALHSPNVRGQWGEMHLRRTVEMAGMLNHVDFSEQTAFISAEDRLQRPDVIINLPNHRKIVVDAKAPLSAYLEAIEVADHAQQRIKLKEHAALLKSHLLKLGHKNYWKQFDPSPEFVVLFLPGEMFFSAALQQDPTLIDFGVHNRVILATPTTLIALLKTVALGWRQETIAEEAKNISQLGATLYDRIAILTNHFSDLRKGLDRANTAYNKAVASVETRILPTTRKFKELHATTNKDIPNLPPLEPQLHQFPSGQASVTEPVSS